MTESEDLSRLGPLTDLSVMPRQSPDDAPLPPVGSFKISVPGEDPPWWRGVPEAIYRPVSGFLLNLQSKIANSQSSFSQGGVESPQVRGFPAVLHNLFVLQ